MDETGSVELADVTSDNVLREFWNWKRDQACAHEDMDLVAERIGNIAGVAHLRSSMRALSSDSYPDLEPILAGLLGLMDDSLPAEAARSALPELDRLLREDVLGSTRIICEIAGQTVDNDVDWGLIDYESFTPIGPQQAVDAETVKLGIRGHHFAIETSAPEARELLRCRVLRQQWHEETARLPPEASRLDQATAMITFTDVETDESVTVRSFGIRRPGEMLDQDGRLPAISRAYPEYLIVSERKVMVSEFWWQLSRLRRLFEAAAETGNPVVWC